MLSLDVSMRAHVAPVCAVVARVFTGIYISTLAVLMSKVARRMAGQEHTTGCIKWIHHRNSDPDEI